MTLDEQFRELIRDAVRKELSAVGVPDATLSVAADPSCLSGGRLGEHV